MMTNYSDEFDNAKVEAGKFDMDDFFSFGANYFNCGYKPKNDPRGVIIIIILQLHLQLSENYMVLPSMEPVTIIRVLLISQKN